MDIALFGATGRTGRRVLQRLLDRGDRVRALARDPARLPASPRLSTIRGDARDAGAVARTLDGASAAIVCLGMADITVPATDFSDSVRTIADGAKAAGARRLIAIASALALPDAQGGLRGEHGVPDVLVHVAAEHVRNYRTLAGSGLDWTLMCPVDLVEDIPEGRARIAYEDLPADSQQTGYEDLAATIVALLDDPAAYGRRVGIVSVR